MCLVAAMQDTAFTHVCVTLPGDAAQQLQLRKAQPTAQQCAAQLALPDLSQSDLIPGKYEGGLKLWEGALDLAAEVAQHALPTSPRPQAATPSAASLDAAAQALQHDALPFVMKAQALAGTRVLELGCGHGLPGLVALLAGAHVVFHVRKLECNTAMAQLTPCHACLGGAVRMFSMLRAEHCCFVLQIEAPWRASSLVHVSHFCTCTALHML